MGKAVISRPIQIRRGIRPGRSSKPNGTIGGSRPNRPPGVTRPVIPEQASPREDLLPTSPKPLPTGRAAAPFAWPGWPATP